MCFIIFCKISGSIPLYIRPVSQDFKYNDYDWENLYWGSHAISYVVSEKIVLVHVLDGQ